MPNAKTQSFFGLRQKASAGAWRLIPFLVIFFLSSISSLYVPEWFNVPLSNPGASPPWYFIRRDFFTGVGLLVGALLLISLLALTWRSYEFTNPMLLMMIGVWMFPGIIKMVIIYIRCSNFFDYDRAVSAWPTFDAYLGSRLDFVGLGLALVITIPIFISLSWRQIREYRRLSRLA